MSYFFTSESVSPGHPDKICDRISDAVLDAALKDDKESKVAVEALCMKGYVQIAGQMSTTAYVDIDSIARDSIKKSGYIGTDYFFDANTCGVNIAIDEQSKDISSNVFKDKKKQGAGDQGIMFGFACSETKNYMPLAISLAHSLMKKQHEVFNSGEIKEIGPDAKAQVTVQYSNSGKIEKVTKVLIATQHQKSIALKKLRNEVSKKIIKSVFAEYGYKVPDSKNILINPSGPFIIGGPVADTGLTGRKIIVDTYGGAAKHGGGAFSGKDPSKVDRSAAYALRQVAKSVVANKLATKCEVQASYALGIAEPTSFFVNTFGTGNDRKIEEIVNKKVDLRPGAIIERLGLKRPIYTKTSNFGHFNNEKFPWEKIIKF